MALWTGVALHQNRYVVFRHHDVFFVRDTDGEVEGDIDVIEYDLLVKHRVVVVCCKFSIIDPGRAVRRERYGNGQRMVPSLQESETVANINRYPFVGRQIHH
jgi:hypothetical protein